MIRSISLLLLILLTGCAKVLHLSEVKPASNNVDAMAALPQDSSILTLIAPYKKELDAEMNQVIGEVAVTMVKAKPQSTLGNWFADLVQEKAIDYAQSPIDFAVVNYGGVRIPEIRKGPIVRGKIYELMPFENRLVVLKIDGEVVQEFIEFMAKGGGWPISKGVRYEITNGTAQNIKIGESDLDVEKTYSVALPDFIANGGGNCDFLIDQPREELGILLRDVIFTYIEEQTNAGKALGAVLDDRVISLD